MTFAIEGTNADKFSLGAKTDNTIVVSAKGDNASTAAYTANLVAKVAGATVATVALKQAAPVSGDGGTVEIDFSAKGYANGVDVTTVTESPLTLTFAKSTGNNPPKYYTSGTAVRMYAANTLTITGATITNVEYTMVDGYNNLIVTDGLIRYDVDRQFEQSCIYLQSGTGWWQVCADSYPEDDDYL